VSFLIQKVRHQSAPKVLNLTPKVFPKCPEELKVTPKVQLKVNPKETPTVIQKMRQCACTPCVYHMARPQTFGSRIGILAFLRSWLSLDGPGCRRMVKAKKAYQPRQGIYIR
jgi:hypothetical protein